jgi:uncharacterized protein involved in exopolysaccharide biosynthesis
VSAEQDAFLRESDVDLQEIIARFWPRRWWIVGATLLSLLIVMTIAFVMPPVYRATTVMVPATHEGNGMGALSSALGQLGGLASLAGLNVGSGSPQTEEALAVLRSRDFTQRFIHDNSLLPELFKSRWDARNQRWRVSGERVPTLADGARYFQKHVRSLNHDKKTGLVTLNVEWTDPDMAALWANDLVGRLNAEMRARAIASTTASLTYLNAELSATAAVDTRQAINRLIETQVNQRMFANVTKEYAFRVVDVALAPDRNDKVWPNKPLLAAIGLFVGFALGLVIAFTLNTLSDRRRPTAL